MVSTPSIDEYMEEDNIVYLGIIKKIKVNNAVNHDAINQTTTINQQTQTAPFFED
jgi:hypothetical protein